MFKKFLYLSLLILGVFFISSDLYAQAGIPSLNINLSQTQKPAEVVNVVKVLLILTILTLAPSILIMMTSFTRLIVVFSFVRQALGTQQMPPNQVLIGLSLFLTFFIMGPTFQKVNDNAIQPYLDEKITREVALENAEAPLREFMFAQTRPKDIELFHSIAKKNRPKNKDDVSTAVLVPAFMVSELKTAFQIGFMIFLPFLILDMVVASVLMSMGMMMLPPVIVSLPFKLMLFVLVDGWTMVVGSLVKSFM
jgi:flagellar biosynthetic protein FliP